MSKVGLQVMSAVLLPLACGSCATQSGILYGSKIELDSDRGNGSKKVDEVGLFFSDCFGRIELGLEDGAVRRRIAPWDAAASHTCPTTAIAVLLDPLDAVHADLEEIRAGVAALRD